MSRAPAPEWNQTAVDYPRDLSLAHAFALQAARTPDSVAIATKSCTLSYRDLDVRSNQLARHLQSLGVTTETLVGVAMERNELLLISMFAILKAGGAYVPLDPEYPSERLAWVIEDSGMPVILTTAQSRNRLPKNSSRVIEADTDSTIIQQYSTESVASTATPENLAYVIYTSGSTGKPKGVMVEQRNVINFFTGMDAVIGATPGVWLAVTSISFDISVLEIFWTLSRGFTVVLHGEGGAGEIADEIKRHNVTHLQMTPSLARMLTLDPRNFASLAQLKILMLGGEALPASLVTQLQQVFHGELHNMYGPTETTIWSTTCRVQNVGSTVPIGRPIANTQIYLLDTEMKSVAVGEPGDLYIGGDGVARGYWKRPDLTADRFITLPAIGSGRLYRTGDLARYLDDGNIEFLGRADYQVKIRGHRIEPGEIEALLEQCSGIRQAVVMVREDRADDKRLAAYLVADSQKNISPNTLRASLAEKLPEFMVPSTFIFVDAFPLTDNGKIDRKALLSISPPQNEAAPAANQPDTDLERTLVNLWQDALNVKSIGVDDNYFDLGAHSLTVAEVHARLQETLGRDVALLDLFQYSTVRTLAAHLDGSQPQVQSTDRAQRRLMARQQ